MYKEFKKTFGFGDIYPDTPYFRSVGLAGKSHLGIDRLMPVGTPIIAPADGIVQLKQSSVVGNEIDFYCNDGSLTRYLHCSEYNVPEGPVKKGDVIAYSGNTGVSTSPHLHWDVWPKGKYTGKIEDCVDPERFWADPIKVKILYTVDGDIRRLDWTRKWFRPFVNMEFDYELVPEKQLEKTGGGKFFKDSDVQFKYIPYADGYDICVLMTPQLDNSTGLLGYYDRDQFFGIEFTTVRLDYNRTRSQNDPDMPKGMIEGVLAHELCHAFAEMAGRRWPGNDNYQEEVANTDNTHHFDYVKHRLVDFAATFDARHLRRSRQHLYMFKVDRGGTTTSPVPEKINRVYRNWDNTFFAAYTVQGWEKISEEDYKKSKAKGAASMVVSNRGVRWILKNSDIEFEFPIVGIRVTKKGSWMRQLRLRALGWTYEIPKIDIT